MKPTYSIRSRSSLSSISNRKKSITAVPVPIPSQLPRNDNGLLTMRYEEASSARPPIAVTVPPPFQPPTDLHPAFRDSGGVTTYDGMKNPGSGIGKTKATEAVVSCDSSGVVLALSGDDIGVGAGSMVAWTHEEERKRDSAMANTTSGSERESVLTDTDSKTIAFRTTSMSAVTVEEIIDEDLGMKIKFGAPPQQEMINLPGLGSSLSTLNTVASHTKKNESRWNIKSAHRTAAEKKRAVVEDVSPSIAVAIPTEDWLEDNFIERVTFTKRGSVMLGDRRVVDPQTCVNSGDGFSPSIYSILSDSPHPLSIDQELQSLQIRAMYEPQEIRCMDGSRSSHIISAAEGQADRETRVNGSVPSITCPGQTTSAISLETKREWAGGIENWEDINGQDVDRYGFITTSSSISRPCTPGPHAPHRVSTLLQLRTDAPRKRRGLLRSHSGATSRHGIGSKVSAKSIHTANSAAMHYRAGSRIREVVNHLPGNKERKVVDEAGDMLTLPPGLAEQAKDEESSRVAVARKEKESQRAEKWRKMAKVVYEGGKDKGVGMEFEFDTRSPKLIHRTWKGIPDRWRAAVWWWFMKSSAQKDGSSVTEEELIRAFHALLLKPSADDVQIDIDVPRTINSHIMFRKRYRGGQRLLFRVLHSLSLYFPQTGYVQGMASLAATLLCYFDEERAFVMLVRMWTLRGMAKLYESGFLGLMAALDEFQQNWLMGRDVAVKLKELEIDPTAFGTRWYLTLFNYSIPFPAQLRIWDVFLLLGDASESPPTLARPFGGGIDVIHATSAALIDGTREILLDSDFENAMKVLTGWIPVKDEELLMKVARAEWKLRQKRN